MCYRYAMINDLKSFATSVRKWSRHLTDFPTDRFQSHDWQVQCHSVLKEIYWHLCLTNVSVKTALVDTGPRPFVLQCSTPWGGLYDIPGVHGSLVSDILIEARVDLAAGRLSSSEWLQPTATCSLRKYGMEWFDQRSFFEKRGQKSQALWMDLALARQSRQQLSNHYVITNSLAMAHLHRFFRAAVRSLTSAYDDLSITQVVDDVRPSICDQMRREIANNTEEFDPSTDQASGFDIPVREAATPLVRPTATPPPVMETPRWSITLNNRSLAVLESGTVGGTTMPYALSQGGCFECINRQHGTSDIRRASATGSVDLSHTKCRTSVANRSTRGSVSCAHLDLAVARRNVAEFTYYLDLHSEHLAACAGALDYTVPLMSAETFPWLPGGIRSALQEVRRDQ